MTVFPTARVAIITRTKNRLVFLRRAIESVLQQSYQDWHHVVVNDGGDPEAMEQLLRDFEERYQGRLSLLHHPISLGMEAAANAGIKGSTSEFIVIHDDDDSWKPSFLRRCVDYLEAPPPVLSTPIRGVATYSTKVVETFDGDQLKRVSTEPFNTWMKSISLYRMASNNSIPPISFLYQRSALEEVGLYREELPVLGDWDFHLRFLARFEIGLIQEELAYYHYRLDIMEGVSGNTVIAQKETHLRYDQLIRNDLLRQDLEAQRVGLGFLVNVIQSFENLNRQLQFFSTFFQRLKEIRIVRWLYFKVVGR
ncbi:MAG: glycosyltransferase family 2 protein [Gammaproteobacteria bacterium]|nr:glycosyltransferase family 2 protein [Gammaproteobacteria bacterium]